ncbi:metallophosphoesterase family protein [Paenibacillus thalictri]|uniref:Metallophosphoesterase n=1 Tax=Paenibacillus thalictri TaxID=2527873 RepID=A0A4Q9DPH8_9BACL|nr:metallophosphoesterase family protein [Paenibacillus thalictri]TBL75128.1 metallophosphoesterase [Paenibacillus thalictri]
MKLIVMGDLHYHEVDGTVPEWQEMRNDFYQTFIARFFEFEADAYISLGDLTNYGYSSELQEVYGMIRQYGKPFYHALGNHDLYAQSRREVLAITEQARYHAVTTEQAVLVFIDTAKEMDFEDWGGWVDEEQLQWLEGVVKTSGTKPLLVFAHHPVHKTTAHSDRPKGSIHPDIDMWKILNMKQGTGIYFNGHTHIDSIVKQNNWTFVQLSACLDQTSLRIVEIDQDEISISPVDITDRILIESVETLYNNMKHFKHSPHARGEESDRGCVVPLLSAAER